MCDRPDGLLLAAVNSRKGWSEPSPVAPLYLHENKGAAVQTNEVDFAAGQAQIPLENAVTSLHKELLGAKLTLAPLRARTLLH